MNRVLNAAMVIARRDYAATVLSRTFILFLVGPLVALLFIAGLTVLGATGDREALRPAVAVVGTPAEVAPVRAAFERLQRRIRARSFPDIRFVAPAGDRSAQISALLAATDKSPSAVLTGWPDAPRLHGPASGIDRVEESVELILDEVRTDAAFARAGLDRPRVALARTVVDPAGGGSSSNRHLIARVGQTLLFMLTAMLAGMLLSNLVEEKSNKIIEVLAAAVPVDAIFFGKLVAMLGVSFTAIALWTSLAAAALVALLPAGTPIPTPATGWPLFGLLAILYYVMNYFLLGAAFLGVGSQANSVREVQTLSLPITLVQLVVFAAGNAAVTRVADPIGVAAAIFPLSSPLAMLSVAAQRDALWPHLLGLAWQAAWVFVIIRMGAARFRSTVLKSGGAAPKRKAARVTARSAAAR